MKLTHRDIVNAAAAISALSEEKRSYVFDDKVRYRIFKNLKKLQSAAKQVDAERLRIIRDISPKTLTIEPNTEGHATFLTRYEQFLDASDEIDGITQFSTYGDLKFKTNKIPAFILIDLGPLLIEDEDPDVKPA